MLLLHDDTMAIAALGMKSVFKAGRRRKDPLAHSPFVPVVFIRSTVSFSDVRQENSLISHWSELGLPGTPCARKLEIHSERRKEKVVDVGASRGRDAERGTSFITAHSDKRGCLSNVSPTLL